ncbi:hypothetical protein [Chelativorans xinjiangense]|uniref:hypothetical protein n=1 Tax=Chelativorans xinjiangense TaxID=2681485 RepID=UPI00135C2350|nr:hypothetical protein [Chelativorans xinjiangense]
MTTVPKKIKLMADYDSWCLWDLVNIGNIDPETLPLSQPLKKALHAWEKKYNATLNRENPIESGFASQEDAQKFNVEGWRLWEQLTDELDGIEVVYFDNELRAVLGARPSI